MKAKSVLIGAGVVVGGLILIGYNKFNKLKAIFEQMKIQPVDISALQFGLPYINFKLDIKLTNPTTEDFSFSGSSLINLKRIMVYRNGKILGSAEVNMKNIEVPAYSSVVLKHIPFSVALENVMYNLLQMEGFNVSQLTIVGVVEVLGNEYFIEG